MKASPERNRNNISMAQTTPLLKNDDTFSRHSDNLKSNKRKTVYGDLSSMNPSFKVFKQLGITDSKGRPNPQMLLALKVLKINLEDLEFKSFDDFLKKHRDSIIEAQGEEGLEVANLQQLAKKEFNFYDKRRKSKIRQIEDYIKGLEKIEAANKVKTDHPCPVVKG